MDKETPNDDILDLQWLDDLQDVCIRDKPNLQTFFQYKDIDILNQNDNQKPSQQQQIKNNTLSYIPESQKVTSISQNQEDQKQKKKQHFETNTTKFQKNHKNYKQPSYAKAYRQRTKQRYKNLQEQNSFLKKRILDLQSQLRQQQIQLNRFKYPPPDKELSVQELNKQYADLSLNLLSSLKSDPSQYSKLWYPTENYYHQFFLDFYAERGFAGNKKLKILNHHFNEILESILKDSQKYLSLVFAQSKSSDYLIPLPQFQPINNAYLNIFKSEGDLWHRLKTFYKFLHPMSLQFNTLVSQFYKKYEEILCCSNKIHNFLKETYQFNMDIARRRVEMQTWFDFHKYGKMMRKLRYQWFEWMKNLAQKEEQQAKATSKGIKKKKTFQ